MYRQRSCSPIMLWSLVLPVALGRAVAAQTPAASEPLAEVDGEAITAEEVEKAIAAQLSKLEEQIYDLKRQQVEALIAERLLAREAAKRGITAQALLDAEVTTKVVLVTAQEIETFYQGNQARLKGGEARVREQMRSPAPEADAGSATGGLCAIPPLSGHGRGAPEGAGRLPVRGGCGWGVFQGGGDGAGDDRRVYGLSLPLLPVGAADAHAARIPIRRQDEARVPGLSAR